jgi:Methyltransferase domain
VDCCSAHGACAEFFDERTARRALKRYRSKGLQADAARMVAWAAEGGLDDATVLEVGGGIGALAASLLQRGAVSAVDLEVAPGWEPSARELVSETGLEDRLEFRLGDLLEQPDAVGSADVVAMQRVVCCNPDGVRLVGLAAGLARRVLVLSYPRDAFWTRWGLLAANGVERLRRQSFRAFVHRPEAILAAAQDEGLVLRHRERGPIWEVAALSRT